MEAADQSLYGSNSFSPAITTTSGRSFEIRHPEMIQVGRSTMTIFTFPSDEPAESKERQIEVSLLLTESVEPLDVASRPQGA